MVNTRRFPPSSGIFLLLTHPTRTRTGFSPLFPSLPGLGTGSNTYRTSTLSLIQRLIFVAATPDCVYAAPVSGICGAADWYLHRNYSMIGHISAIERPPRRSNVSARRPLSGNASSQSLQRGFDCDTMSDVWMIVPYIVRICNKKSPRRNTFSARRPLRGTQFYSFCVGSRGDQPLRVVRRAAPSGVPPAFPPVPTVRSPGGSWWRAFHGRY